LSYLQLIFFEFVLDMAKRGQYLHAYCEIDLIALDHVDSNHIVIMIFASYARPQFSRRGRL